MAKSDNEKDHNDDEQPCVKTLAGKIKDFINENCTAIMWVLVALIGYLLMEQQQQSNVVSPAPQVQNITVTPSSTSPGANPANQMGGVLRLGNNILGRNYNQPGFTTTPSGLSRFL